MNLDELIEIVAKLRGPGGCPWDREQTRESLKPFLVEEFYELIDAIEDNDQSGIKEELGDLLFQIVIQSQLAMEEGLFDIKDVIKGISDKMVQRHPHVFGDKELNTSGDVKIWWEEFKKKEGKQRASIMDDVPRSLPALLRAQQIQFKASKAGFDWEKIDDIIAKLDEEVNEFKSALANKKKSELENEFGDILFVLVRIANYMDVNPEDSLRKTISKFIRRFKYMEESAARNDKKIENMKMDEMDKLWNEAKGEFKKKN